MTRSPIPSHCGSSMLWRSALILLSSAVAVGQSEPSGVRLTIPAAVTMALAHNRHLALAHLSVSDAEEQRRVAEAKFYPTIHNTSLASYVTQLQGIVIPAGSFSDGGAAGPVPSQTVRIDQGASTTYASLTELTQPITQAFKVHASVRAAAADLRSAKITSEDEENAIALQVHQLYYSLLIEQARLDAAQSAVDAADIQEKETEDGVKQGRLLPDAELEARTQLLDRKQAVLISRLTIGDLGLQFDSVLGLPLGTQIVLDDGTPAAPEDIPARDAAMSEAIEKSPGVLEARQGVEKARAGVSAAKDAYIPDITGLARYNYQSGISFFLHNFGTLGGMVTYDLFDGGSREAHLKSARIKLASAITALSQAEDDVRMQISASYDQIEELQSLIAVSQESIRAREESVRIQTERAQQHAALPSTLSSARSELSRAHADMLRAQLNLYLVQNQVKRLLGLRPN